MTRRRLFNFVAGVSLLVFAATLVIDDWSADSYQSLGFLHGGAHWEIAVGGGRCWLGNGPEVGTELEKIAAVERRLKDDYAWRSGMVHARVDAAEYGSAEYQAALQDSRDLAEAYERDRDRAAASRSITPVSHSLQLSNILIVTAIAPPIWLIAWVRRHRGVWCELRSPAAVAAVILLLISIGILVVSIRSYRVGAMWMSPFGSSPMARPPGWPATSNAVMLSGRVLTLSRGQIQFYQAQIPHMGPARVPERSGYFRGGGIMIQPARIGSVVPPPPSEWWVPGISYSARPVFMNNRAMMVGYHSLIVSTWLVWLLCMVYPLIWVRGRWKKLRMERRRLLNLCMACGYSLSGNVSGVCPECGVAATFSNTVIA